MNLDSEHLNMSDDELANSIGFDTLIRLASLNWKEQVERRMKTVRELSDDMKRFGFGEVKH